MLIVIVILALVVLIYTSIISFDSPNNEVDIINNSYLIFITESYIT
jgi:uncharacterized protein YxeA